MSHHDSKKNLYEYRAKNTLIAVFPNEFDNLEKSEKPDWVDTCRSVGVEVVRATDSDSLVAINKSLRILGKRKSSLHPRDIKAITKYGGHLFTEGDLGITNSDVIVSHVIPSLPADKMTLCAFCNKIEHLNTTAEPYSSVDQLFLYIVCDTGISRETIINLFARFNEIQKGLSSQFDEVFVDDGKALFRFRFSDKHFSEQALTDFNSEIARQSFQETTNLGKSDNQNTE